jgi:hypothetical protein
VSEALGELATVTLPERPLEFNSPRWELALAVAGLRD